MKIRTPRAGLAAPALASLLVLSACGGASEADEAGSGSTVTVEVATGEVEVPENPEKVFSYDFAAVSVLEELGVDVDGVPTDSIPDNLPELAERDDLTNIGTLFEPDMELVAEEQPDLVLVGGRSASQADALEETGADVVDISNDWAANVESSTTNALALGEIFGKEKEAEALVEEMRTAIAETKALGEEAGTGLIVLTSGGKLSAYGEGGRFGFLHSDLGIEPAAEIEEEEQHGQSISWEFLLETDPDWIFVVDRDAVAGDEDAKPAEEVFDNAVVKKTKAFKNDQIVFVDTTDWYLMGGGVPALTNIATEVGDALEGASAQ